MDKQRVEELLNYDPDSGVFTWKAGRQQAKEGDIAGGKTSRGYWHIKLDGTLYLAHRLAWLVSEGVWPPGQIDHINHDRVDNRRDNLRLANSTINNRNASRCRTNTSGITGVCWDSNSRKWRAQIGVAGEQVHLGYFTSKAQAVAARKAAEATNKYHENHVK